MTLVRTGQGVTDIRGGTGGVYFTRDKSGLHQSAKPRTVHRRSSAQDKQRNCFTKARTYSTDNRVVSYLIYRCLNNLPFLFDAFVTGNTGPDVTGKYVDKGIFGGKRYYQRTDEVWHLWYSSATGNWFITHDPGVLEDYVWQSHLKFEGPYLAILGGWGTAYARLELAPPPADYQIPKL